MTAVDRYRAELRSLAADEWDAYLGERSGLPGLRANLELAQAVAAEADAARFRRYAASDDEYRAFCGAAGLGRLLGEGDHAAAGDLRRLAADRRWRVREGVAVGLQLLGDIDIGVLLGLAGDWVRADGEPLVQRAAVAAVCEPRLLAEAATVRAVLDLLDRATESLVRTGGAQRRRSDVRVLRQGLGYCWSVAVAALPAEGFSRLARWASADDPDAVWVVRQNLMKARMARADAGATERLRALVERRPAG